MERNLAAARRQRHHIARFSSHDHQVERMLSFDEF
jgi:hypothetical protein